MDQAVDRVGLESIEDLDYIVDTGCGRSKVSFANENIAGINHSVAGRLNSMVRRVGLIEDVALTGGCSRNEGLVKALENKLRVEVKKLPVDPQIAGALGAAIVAGEKRDL